MKKLTLLIFILFILFSANSFSQGCLESSSGDGAKIIGYIQPQFNYNFNGKNLAGESLNTNSFVFNRARIGVTGSIPYDIDYYVLVEASSFFTGNPFLLDAFITYKRLGPWAKFSMGSFKVPISLELNTPCNGLHTINRSVFVDELTAPNRDIGIMALGASDSLTIFGMETFNLIKYSFAVTNGTGLGITDDNRGKNYSGRVVLSPVKGLSLGVSYLYGKQKPNDETATEDDLKKRFGFDLEYRYKNFLMQGEYLHGEDKGSYTTGGGCGSPPVVQLGSINRAGYFVSAMYLTPWKLEPVFKFETYDPNLAEDESGDIQNIMTFGLNYFLNDWTRIQVNYLYKAEETAAAEKANDCLLVQLQVKIK
jgi:phosphate-selective porin